MPANSCRIPTKISPLVTGSRGCGVCSNTSVIPFSASAATIARGEPGSSAGAASAKTSRMRDRSVRSPGARLGVLVDPGEDAESDGVKDDPLGTCPGDTALSEVPEVNMERSRRKSRARSSAGSANGHNQVRLDLVSQSAASTIRV